MNCPSCSHANVDNARFCARCRMAFSSVNIAAAKMGHHLHWILRRATAGFGAGFVAWFFIPFVSRSLSQASEPMFLYALTGMMGGAFLGGVEGMLEESTPKTLRGAVMGGLGGVLGGVVFAILRDVLVGDRILWGVFLYWALPGAFIGSVSAQWERRPAKLIAGVLAGFLGGGIGAYIGAGMHANIVQQYNVTGWSAHRILEALIGATIGVTMWFAIGAAERFVIFKRRPLRNPEHKTCDACGAKNQLSSWYCGACGAVIQEAAPPGKLNLSPYSTLARVRDMFHFLSRLSVASGFIAAFVSFFVFIPGDPFLILVVLVLIGTISYALQIVFGSLSETLEIALRKP